jgi:NAD(P)-dependent dehydrogenase (short-subunit alcohol dehydrogenase family)
MKHRNGVCDLAKQQQLSVAAAAVVGAVGVGGFFVCQQHACRVCRGRAMLCRAVLCCDGCLLTCLLLLLLLLLPIARLSADGYELTWAVNVLAPFLLTSLLWRHVEPGGQIVTTASISAASHLDMRNLQQEKGYR